MGPFSTVLLTVLNANLLVAAHATENPKKPVRLVRMEDSLAHVPPLSRTKEMSTPVAARSLSKFSNALLQAATEVHQDGKLQTTAFYRHRVKDSDFDIFNQHVDSTNDTVFKMPTGNFSLEYVKSYKDRVAPGKVVYNQPDAALQYSSVKEEATVFKVINASDEDNPDLFSLEYVKSHEDRAAAGTFVHNKKDDKTLQYTSVKTEATVFKAIETSPENFILMYMKSYENRVPEGEFVYNQEGGVLQSTSVRNESTIFKILKVEEKEKESSGKESKSHNKLKSAASSAIFAGGAFAAILFSIF